MEKERDSSGRVEFQNKRSCGKKKKQLRERGIVSRIWFVPEIEMV